MNAPRLTATQLATVRGVPGAEDYHGPHWAKIEAKKDKIAKLEARMNEMASQRCDLEDELADLIKEARAIIEASRAPAERTLPPSCDVCGANPRTHACDEEACEPTTGTEGV